MITGGQGRADADLAAAGQHRLVSLDRVVRQQVINILYAEQQPMTATRLASRTSLSPSGLTAGLGGW